MNAKSEGSREYGSLIKYANTSKERDVASEDSTTKTHIQRIPHS